LYGNNITLRNNNLTDNLFNLYVAASATSGNVDMSNYMHNIDTSNLVNGKPNKSEVGYFWVGTDSEWIGHFNSEPFERLTGFRLEPGEIARIPRKRFRELFRGLGK